MLHGRQTQLSTELEAAQKELKFKERISPSIDVENLRLRCDALRVELSGIDDELKSNQEQRAKIVFGGTDSKV